MGLCSWVIFGFFAGLLARAIMPGEQRLGLIATTVLGVGGSFVGGFLGALISGRSWQTLQPSGFLGAVLGALALLAIGEIMSGRRRS
ncbi:MAG: GlsB/YeaQ/YmgE family stress response membrane protein [Myxococcaceae bacterium]|nr:GlsB/YeaQ/YmgE family stress response membrane protein [Myxococcaceae bacterium]MCI0673028.1 GlsB/YeaQ/YmgE family stress response membrane protein [Myxococcaceae bacterium]